MQAEVGQCSSNYHSSHAIRPTALRSHLTVEAFQRNSVTSNGQNVIRFKIRLHYVLEKNMSYLFLCLDCM